MIALFDSGIGGISILREIRRLLPTADAVYFGDTANVPYGGRPAADIIGFSRAAVEQLLPYRPSVLVVACNTATSVAISALRDQYSDLPIVGVVPVLKIAAERTTSKHVGVLATQATLSSVSYQNLKQQFANGIQVLELAVPEWVTFVERGELDGPAVERSVRMISEQVRAAGADVVALGCTHFPFLRSALVAELPGVEVLDSGPAVARQVVRVLTNNHSLPSATESGRVTWLTSGPVKEFERYAERLLRS
ncbi:MAG: glutamate racemase [Candidatus Kerfeldbacteria bacterium]|nr:glutamate racemase [Candidatus Kerfeldbacteria bacterium]